MKQKIKITKKAVFTTVFLTSFLIFATCQNKDDSGRKKIGVVIYDKVLTSDITAPLEVLGIAALDASFEYDVISIAVGNNKNIKTHEGLKLQADFVLADSPKLHVLIVPGAYDLESFYANQKFMNFLKKQGATATWVVSNCAGAFLLGRAGLLDGKRATTWAGGEADLQKENPQSLVQFNKNVVIDENLITSNGGIVSYQAAFALLEKLATPKTVAQVKEAIQYSRLVR